MIQHGETGRFLSPNCDDPNCGVMLGATTETVFGRVYPVWACDGLTYEVDTGPLVACRREFPR